MPPYIMSKDSITVYLKNSEPKTYSRDSDSGKRVVEFIKNGDEDGLVDYINSFKKTVEASSSAFRVENDVVFVKNEEGEEEDLPRTLGKRLVEHAHDNIPYQPILNFWGELRQNTSFSAIHRLFDCLDANHHPLMEDGRFMAWKRVRADLKDIHSGKFDNSVGSIVKVRRNQVDENMDQTCSFGLHVSSYNYAKNHYGNDQTDVLLEVAVNPKDVVAIPRDYNSQKMRVCEYEVLGIVQEERKEKLYGYTPHETEIDDEEDDYDDTEYCDDCDEELDDCRCSDEELEDDDDY